MPVVVGLGSVIGAFYACAFLFLHSKCSEQRKSIGVMYSAASAWLSIHRVHSRSAYNKILCCRHNCQHAFKPENCVFVLNV